MKLPRTLLQITMAAMLLVLTACGSGEVDTSELAGADLTLDREVLLTYDVPEIVAGESFLVRVYADEVVGEKTRFSVDLADSDIGVTQDTCEEALEMAAEMASNLETVVDGDCYEVSRSIIERFHEVHVEDASGEVTLQLSSEAPLPYTVNVTLITDDEQSGCPVIGHTTLEPDQDRLHLAVDSWACDGD